MTPQPVDEFEYISIFETGRSESGKTARYSVVNRKHGADLGTISWYAVWRQYCFEPLPRTLYSAGCLNDIATFVEHATAAQRSGRLRSRRES